MVANRNRQLLHHTTNKGIGHKREFIIHTVTQTPDPRRRLESVVDIKEVGDVDDEVGEGVTRASWYGAVTSRHGKGDNRACDASACRTCAGCTSCSLQSACRDGRTSGSAPVPRSCVNTSARSRKEGIQEGDQAVGSIGGR